MQKRIKVWMGILMAGGNDDSGNSIVSMGNMPF